MATRRTLRCLLLAVLGLPLVHAILWWAARLLEGLGDPAAAHVLGRLNLAASILWLIVVVALVVVLGVHALDASADDETP